MFNKTMQKLGEERSIIRETFEYANLRAKEIGKENVFDFSLGNPNVPAPKSVDEELERLCKTTPSQILHGYTSAAGAPEVRAAIATYIKDTFQVEARADLIYLTCGAAASLTITLNALAEEGDEFVILAPYFPEYKIFIERAGGKVKEVNTDKTFHLDIEALDRAIGKNTKAVLINSPNNPSGAVYSEEEILSLATLLKRKSDQKGSPVFLISDEPYRELVYDTKVPYVMSFYDHSVVCYSFSKSLSLAGERIGYIAIHPACACANEFFAAVAGAGRSLGYVCAPALFQKVCAANLGKSSDINAYRKNRDLLCGTLSEYGFSCVQPEGAFYLFLKSPEEDAAAFCKKAREYELLLVPSDSFGVKGYVRISYCVSQEVIKQSLPAFKRLAQDYGLF